MDFFQQSRYRINKLLLSLVGLWPYQNKCESSFFLGLTVLCSCSLVSAQIRKVIIDRHNPDTIIEAVSPFITDIVCVIKVSNSIINSEKVRLMCQILKRIQNDLTATIGPEEKVLLRCVDDGRKFSLIYTVWLYFSMLCFLVCPFAPRIIVSLGIANISAPAQFPFPVDYFVDPEENYVYLQTHICIGVFFIITMIISVDGMFVVCVQHACGIFSAISYRLENLAGDRDTNFQLHPNRITDETFWIVIDCVKKHNEAIRNLKRFVELIDATYSWSFFFLVGLNMAVLSFSGYQVVLKMSSGDVDQVFNQVLFTGGQLMHLFFESYFSQRLTDHSLRVYEALNRVRWYETSMRTRKLLRFMLMRSVIPCELKAGKIYTMSMENFSVIVRTSMSYFTVLCSME